MVIAIGRGACIYTTRRVVSIAGNFFNGSSRWSLEDIPMV